MCVFNRARWDDLALVFAVISGLLATGCGKPAGSTSPRAKALAPRVVVLEATVQPVEETLSMVGTLAANESVELKAENDGVIREIHFLEGQTVAKGDLLVSLDQEKLEAAVAEAEANFKLSQGTFQRNEQLLRDKLVSHQEYDQAAATYDYTRASLELKKRQLRDARLTAPFDGVIGARSVSPGQVITRSTPITWLINLDPVKVEIGVPERFLNQLRPGQEVGFQVAAFPGRRFEGKVYFVASHLDQATRTALVKASIPNPGGLLKPGMFASLLLTLRIRESALVVPEVAIMATADTFSLFVVGADAVAQMRTVKIGVRLAGWVEVIEGLKAGEKVVVEGTQKTLPGRPVSVAPPEAAAAYRMPPGRSH